MEAEGAPECALRSDAVKVAVVGGAGQMGAWLVRFWEARGCQVRISDRGTELSNLAVAEWADVTFVAVPLHITTAVLDEIRLAVRRDAALVSIASLMGPSAAAMAGTPGEAICAHPVFGPTVSALTGLPVVLAAEQPGTWDQWLTRHFSAVGMNVQHCTAVEHDARMSFVQALVHSLFVALTAAFEEGFLAPPTALPWASPTLRLQFGLAARILGQDPGLYADLVIGNAAAPAALDVLIRQLQRLADLARAGDRSGFIAAFESSRASFGETLGPLAAEAEAALARDR